MRKGVFSAIMLLAFVSSVLAAPFSPAVMKIVAPSVVQYDFDGTQLEFSATISGAPASALFCVYTKDQGAKIGTVLNGFLGWHFVNKIDTSIYISQATALDVGNNTIKWDGKDENGKPVPAGEYSYYIWAYDNVNAKKIVTKQIAFQWNETSIIQIMDKDGKPLANPVIWEGGRRASVSPAHTRQETWQRKWTIGNDPEDATLVESTKTLSAEDLGSIALDYKDYSMFWKVDGVENGTAEIRKFKWVPNGDAILQTSWGDNGKFAWTLSDGVPTSEFHEALTTVEGGTDIFANNSNFPMGVNPISELIYIDMESGDETTRVDLADWWVDLAGGEAGGQAGGGPSDVINAGDQSIGGPLSGMLHLSCHGSCINQLLDPYRDGEVGGDVNDLTLWVNDNGDYVGDHNYEPESVRPWVCNDYNPGPYKYWTGSDKYGFAQFPSYNLGASSFGLFAPDGTGIGYFAFAGETSDNKFGHRFLQYGSPYDGMYQDGNATGEGGIWTFIARNSVKGTLTNLVAVEEAPAAFAVAQNAPNPFNPTTTINFYIPEAGTTTIAIFNIAGQKVDTIANEFLSAGSHSVMWDASGFSAGVYFYTVTSGKFTKTMKMTLLK